MAVSITWLTGVILVPKADTTLVDIGPPERRSYDLNTFRGEVMALWASEEGGPYSVPFIHNQEVTVGTNVYARSVIFLDPYTIEFEDGQYVVLLEGANHNVLDVRVANQVSVDSNNSAGLIASTKMEEIHNAMGLESGDPFTHPSSTTPTGGSTRIVELTATEAGDGRVTVERTG